MIDYTDLGSLIAKKYSLVTSPTELEIKKILVSCFISESLFLSEKELFSIVFANTENKRVFRIDSIDMSASVSILNQISEIIEYNQDEIKVIAQEHYNAYNETLKKGSM